MFKTSCISLTFDDGWKSQFCHAAPILDEHGIKATFYIITYFIRVACEAYMSCEDVRQLSERGHEIGAHTVNHPNLVYTFPWKLKEIKRSRAHLIERGIYPKSFAYPYGSHNFLVRYLVKRAGFENSRITDHGYNPDKPDRWRIHGKFIMADTSLDVVEGWIQEAITHNKWLVFIFHQVQDSPGLFGCTPGFLNEVCLLVNKMKIRALPLSEALKMYEQ